MATKNLINLSFSSNTENVSLARMAAAMLTAQAELTISEIEEIKIAVSEAVSNAIIHGYGDTPGIVELTLTLFDDKIEYLIIDRGKGIEDIEAARQPSFSTDPERMGLGFVFMESFMDKLEVESQPGKGTKITMTKYLDKYKTH